MNRTDRLYALVEELRAVAPRPRTSRWLARRFEVSIRTIERDISALQQAGIPIWATIGPGGGYTIDPEMTLPPVNFTAGEALAVSLALARAGTMPFEADARSALLKLMAAMSGTEADEARRLAERIRLLVLDPVDPAPGIPAELEQAVLTQEVIELDYRDRQGETTIRLVEPVAFVAGEDSWYLVAWCRLRSAARSFRVDRIEDLRLTGEQVGDARPVDLLLGDIPHEARRLPIAE